MRFIPINVLHNLRTKKGSHPKVAPNYDKNRDAANEAGATRQQAQPRPQQPRSSRQASRSREEA